MDLKQKFVGAVEDEWQMYSDQLSDYTIGPPIGFGASSIVHTAVFQPPPSSNAPTPCALKVVDLDRLPPHALHLLMQETKLMSLSKHPNVLRIRGQWMDGHKLHIAMRLMNAGSAADVMRYAWPGGMEEEVVKCILKQTLEGLNYLHTNGLIHRDVKAANLLIDDDGTVLLGDLGVAAPLWESDSAPRHAYPMAHYTPSSSYTHTHPHHLNAHSHTPKRILGKRKSFVGTPCWMAPEVITGKQYNASADIWSFGITALELTSGHPPLSRSSPSAVLSHIASSPPPSLTRDNGVHKYSSTFFDIVQSCLNKDPAQRPTAEQLLDSSFFKGAKKKGYLVGTVLKGLPPLVQRQERRQLPSLMTHTTMDSWDFALTESSTSDSTGGTPIDPSDPDVPASAQSATPPSQLLWRKLVGRRKESFGESLGEGDSLREKDASGGGDTLRRKVGMLAGKGVGIMRTVSRVGTAGPASPSSTQPHTSSPPLAAINDIPASVHVLLNIMSSVVQEHATILPLLSRALNQIRSTPPRIIASPATQPRRAAVALILRVSPPPTYPTPSTSTALPPPATLAEFFQLDWVNAPGARPEILFLRREKPDDGTERINGAGASSEAHVAFPGGRTEDGDEGGMYTAMRQTWEEIGLDLAESAYTPVGQLDDREITTSLGKRLLMILSPFVFLQLTPHTTPIDPAPGTSLHWVPLSELLPDSLTAGKEQAGPRVRRPRWSSVTVDASSRLAPRHSPLLRFLVKVLVGNMKFPAILINPAATSTITSAPTDDKVIDQKRAFVENGAHVTGTGLNRQGSLSKLRPRQRNEELKLWGLSLGMTLDLLAHMALPTAGNGADALVPPDAQIIGVPALAPSLTSVFPRFSYPDVNFWIWVFAKRYREVVRGWEASVRGGGTNDRRINWTGSALNTFYAAVRKALVVVIVVRAILVLLGFLFGGWFLFLR
ncbi:hypothetical protein EW026_g3725 [Hermanssonia centrifuga]|uniref:Nudix hydrolase domain-containing protein n=1 Tax=Hermanssonia centrifuga TaxID=98765 RepID=A0A4V3XAK5_9APHY|nr:hypothetical protein EW026_g3725 [Hermanssonia centrifuga]